MVSDQYQQTKSWEESARINLKALTKIISMKHKSRKTQSDGDSHRRAYKHRQLSVDLTENNSAWLKSELIRGASDTRASNTAGSEPSDMRSWCSFTFQQSGDDAVHVQIPLRHFPAVIPATGGVRSAVSESTPTSGVGIDSSTQLGLLYIKKGSG